MSESDDPALELADELFASAREEEPSAEGRARAMTALGIADVTGGSGGDGGASGTTAPQAGVSAGVKAAGFLGLATVAVVGIWLASSSGDRSEPTSATAPSSVPLPSAARSSSIEAPTLSPTASVTASAASSTPAHHDAVEPTASVESTAAKKPPRPAAPASAPSTATADPPTDPLAAELADLDRARERLRSGDASGALTRLDAYTKSHPRGALATEATLLRIEALVAAGRRDEARSAAAPFLERRDMTGDRARRLLER
ncbi:MAG: hypothetical protein KF819_32390 [Labilithrix sp.]|nr:hypothetical protein [Labilithrix sp.]